MKKIVVITGAGISAESGINTFRDTGGLWEGYNVMEVASPDGWQKNQQLVLDFYNQRRAQVLSCQPNAGHIALKDLESKYQVTVVTQNIDDLHERAGSSNVIHLHGELLKARSTKYPKLVYEWKKDINVGDNCEKGAQLRPHIVWFGEMVPLIEVAMDLIEAADIAIIIGTSMQVYPAAGLIGYLAPGNPIYYVDPKPMLNYELKSAKNVKIVAENASTGVRKIVDELMSKS